MRLILDTNVLLSNPHILSKGGSTTKFLIPHIVLEELLAGRLAEGFKRLFRNAEKNDRIRFLMHPTLTPAQIADLKFTSKAETLLLQTALGYQQEQRANDVYFVSDDLKLLKEAKGLGIRAIDSQTAAQLLEPSSNGNEGAREVSEAADAVDRFNRNYLISAFVLGILVTTGLMGLWKIRESIIETLPIWGICLATVGAGVSLFWFRSRHRLSYGTVEVLFGLLTAARVAKMSSYDATMLFQMVAGIYIIVRGLDNIEKGINGTKVERRWRRFFAGESV